MSLIAYSLYKQKTPDFSGVFFVSILKFLGLTDMKVYEVYKGL